MTHFIDFLINMQKKYWDRWFLKSIIIICCSWLCFDKIEKKRSRSHSTMDTFVAPACLFVCKTSIAFVSPNTSQELQLVLKCHIQLLIWDKQSVAWLKLCVIFNCLLCNQLIFTLNVSAKEKRVKRFLVEFFVVLWGPLVLCFGCLCNKSI